MKAMVVAEYQLRLLP